MQTERETDYYAKSNDLRGAWRAALLTCDHADRVYSVNFGAGDIVETCDACERAAEPLKRAYETERAAARKRQLADTPRCDADGCNRRARWNFPCGVSVCGIHRTRMLRAHARAVGNLGGLAIAIPAYSGPDDLLRWANDSDGKAVT